MEKVIDLKARKPTKEEQDYESWRDCNIFLMKTPQKEIVDTKVKVFTERGIKFIRHTSEVNGVKHDIVMTIEAFNKLSASKKKLFMGGNS